MRKGDIIVNPWVSKEIDGKLNPNYATIYIGNRNFIDYKGRVKHWSLSTKVNTFDENEEEKEWKVIGHVDIYRMIKQCVEGEEQA